MRRLWIATGLFFSLLMIGCLSTASASTAGQSSGNPAWSLLVDDSARLGIEDVRAQPNRFRPLDRHSLTLPSSRSAVWLRATLAGHDAPTWLWFLAPRVQYLDYYLVQDGQLVRDQHTGESRPFQERPLPSRSYLFSLPALSGERAPSWAASSRGMFAGLDRGA